MNQLSCGNQGCQIRLDLTQTNNNINLWALEPVWGSACHWRYCILSCSLKYGALVCLFVYLQEVDIILPENSGWYERYKSDIPVFHVNGQFPMMHGVNISKLDKQLQKHDQWGFGGWLLSQKYKIYCFAQSKYPLV